MVTAQAQAYVAQELEPGFCEYELEALVDYVFKANGALRAFPSIVASGKNATILHYHDNNEMVKAGDLLVVDIEVFCI